MTDLILETTEAKASYGVGLQMGEQLKQALPGASLDAALAGMKHAFNNETMLIEGEEINAAFKELNDKIQAQQAAEAKEKAAEGQAFLAENANNHGITVTASGLQYEILEAGNGNIPNADARVRTHYRGTLINGKEFDSSYSRNEPSEFPVKGVIAGWTEALQLMPVGSTWKLYIPYNLAYGAQAAGEIPPYSALIFEIELLDIVS